MYNNLIIQYFGIKDTINYNDTINRFLHITDGIHYTPSYTHMN